MSVRLIIQGGLVAGAYPIPGTRRNSAMATALRRCSASSWEGKSWQLEVLAMAATHLGDIQRAHLYQARFSLAKPHLWLRY